MDNNIVIAIEGMVGSGKTSICKELTHIIKKSAFLDGGALYRGIVIAVAKAKLTISQTNLESSEIELSKLQNNFKIQNNMNHLKSLNVFELMKMLKIDFKIENNETIITIDGEIITDEEIQSMESAIGVSKMASSVDNKAFYNFAKSMIDKYRKKYNLIVSGRDLVKIYPDMTCHVFVTASLEERVNRRYNQYKGQYSKEELMNIIIKRDEIHQNAGYNQMGDRNISFDVTDYKSAYESTVNLVNKLIEENYLRREDVIWENM